MSGRPGIGSCALGRCNKARCGRLASEFALIANYETGMITHNRM